MQLNYTPSPGYILDENRTLVWKGSTLSWKWEVEQVGIELDLAVRELLISTKVVPARNINRQIDSVNASWLASFEGSPELAVVKADEALTKLAAMLEAAKK